MDESFINICRRTAEPSVEVPPLVMTSIETRRGSKVILMPPEENYSEELGRWAGQPLDSYGVRGWDPDGGSQGSGFGWVDGQGTRRIVRRSVALSFRGPNGERISISTHRRDDNYYATLRDWAPVNTQAAHRFEMDLPMIRSGRPMPPLQETRAQVMWRPAIIHVDGRPTAFEVCHFGNGYWAAIGRAPEADITIDSRGAALAGLELVRLPAASAEVAVPVPALASSARFPDELRGAAFPADAEPSSRVALAYRDQRLTGTIGLISVNIAMSLPAHDSFALGTLGDDRVTARWHIASDADASPDIVASLDGQCDGLRITVQAQLHFTAEGWFSGGTAIGTIAAAVIRATIERAEGGLESTSTVALRGSIDDVEFILFASVNRAMNRGILRGDIGGEVVYLDATVTPDRQRYDVVGRFSAPATMATLAVGAILYFM